MFTPQNEVKPPHLAKGRVRTLKFRRESFQLLKEFLDGISWETVLKGMGTERSWRLITGVSFNTDHSGIL